MKKTYISPEVTIVTIEKPCLLAGSIQVAGAEGLEGFETELPLDDDQGLFAD